MKITLTAGIIFIMALTASLVSCGAEEGFSEAEKVIIGASGEGIMRLWTTADAADSLFLRRETRELTQAHISSSEFGVLKLRMLATVNDPENSGVGIAAPQVGLPYRLIAVRRFDKQGEPFEFYTNPRITSRSAETAAASEGCLSIPDVSGIVERAQTIELTHRDEAADRTVTETITGFTAVIFQHEIDHLDGILFTDRIE